MDMDNARFLLQRFAEVYPEEENNHQAAYNRVKAENQHVHDGVVARSLNFGHVPPIVVGEQFRYRNQLKLAGLHNDHIRGICYNVATERATAVVIKYPRHNYGDGGAGIYVGGQGGEIAAANAVGERILEHQVMNGGNRSMHNSLVYEHPIRVMVYSEIAPGGNNVGDNPTNMGYSYWGLYTVDEEFELETELGLFVYEYMLHPHLGDDILLLADAPIH